MVYLYLLGMEAKWSPFNAEWRGSGPKPNSLDWPGAIVYNRAAFGPA